MKDLPSLFENKNLWERLQALHHLIIQAGFLGETIRLHPSSVEQLSLELAPKPRRGEVFDPPRITGGVTHAGPFTIIEDEYGVVL